MAQLRITVQGTDGGWGPPVTPTGTALTERGSKTEILETVRQLASPYALELREGRAVVVRIALDD
jgi:hypothetical protein